MERMGHNDLNGFTTSLFTFQRRWKRLPRFLRFYLVLIFLFVIFTLSYYVFIVNKRNINDPNLVFTSGFVPLITNYHQTVKDFSKKSEDSIPLTQSSDNINKQQDDSMLADQQNNEDDNPNITREELKLASLKQNDQQKAIQNAILHSWKGYRNYAWGQDFLKPITRKGQNWSGIGLTILDSLDTLLMAGLHDEFDEALEWIKNDLTFDINDNVNCFETTIRALAGLLSAYHLTNEKILLEKAIDLGRRLIHCFDTPSKKVPYSDVNLKTKIANPPSFSAESSLSEVSTVQLEFRDLSLESNDKTFEEKSFSTSKHIHDLIQIRKNYLLPMYINPSTGNLVPSTITLGARADSYYEYLYKQYAQTKIEFLLEDYINSIAAIKQKLMRTTDGELKLTYIGEILSGDPFKIHPKMDHLVCFLSGILAFGYYHEYEKKLKNPENRSQHDDDIFLDHLKMSEDLARTCNFMYNLTETGLAPEIGYFGQQSGESEFYIKPRDTHNLLRPEFVESLFFLYHITGQQKYRDWGWNIFNAFQKFTKINSGGYTTINDVRHPNNVKPRDFMESFWLAETLKYLYLLFLDDQKIIHKLLNNYIFNTEGHILPRRA